jgi:hypothetical protein
MHLVVISSSDREDTPECKSVPVEISPHFRPDQWDADTLLRANNHPLRFTGQLIYDAAHRPCSGSPPTRASEAPARVSSWEIHPVYAIDVCKKKSLNGCKADNASVWTPLDQWQGTNERANYQLTLFMRVQYSFFACLTDTKRRLFGLLCLS